MHPTFTEQIAAQRIAELHQEAAKQRMVGQLRADATSPRNGRARVSRIYRGFRRSRSAVA
jgi:hypothetical protein